MLSQGKVPSLKFQKKTRNQGWSGPRFSGKLSLSQLRLRADHCTEMGGHCIPAPLLAFLQFAPHPQLWLLK